MYLHSYYLANKEKIRAKSVARYNRCKTEILAQHKKNHRVYKNSVNGRFTIAKQMGIRRGHGWDITFEQYCGLIDIPCFYCGGVVEKYGTGLDRVDSEKGYLYSNVRPCCKRCNQAKNNLTEEDFYTFIRRIYKHLRLEVNK